MIMNAFYMLLPKNVIIVLASYRFSTKLVAKISTPALVRKMKDIAGELLKKSPNLSTILRRLCYNMQHGGERLRRKYKPKDACRVGNLTR